MTSCLLTGGSGFVGTHLARHFLDTYRFDRVHTLDIRSTAPSGDPRIIFHPHDVRKPIPDDLCGATAPDWVFDLAASHREPAHQAYDYYETNLLGGRHGCEYADAVGCPTIFFTSRISVHGPARVPISETSPPVPVTPYGGSKYGAELIQQLRVRAMPGRRPIFAAGGSLRTRRSRQHFEEDPRHPPGLLRLPRL